MAKQMENKLRVFTNVDDLFDSADSHVILNWVNSHAKAIESRKGYQKIYQKKRRLLMAAAEQLLDRDELQRIEDEATKRAAKELQGDVEAETEGEAVDPEDEGGVA